MCLKARKSLNSPKAYVTVRVCFWERDVAICVRFSGRPAEGLRSVPGFLLRLTYGSGLTQTQVGPCSCPKLSNHTWGCLKKRSCLWDTVPTLGWLWLWPVPPCWLPLPLPAALHNCRRLSELHCLRASTYSVSKEGLAVPLACTCISHKDADWLRRSGAAPQVLPV